MSGQIMWITMMSEKIETPINYLRVEFKNVLTINKFIITFLINFLGKKSKSVGKNGFVQFIVFYI